MLGNVSQTAHYAMELAAAASTPPYRYQTNRLNVNDLTAMSLSTTRGDFGTHGVAPLLGPNSNIRSQLSDSAIFSTAQGQQKQPGTKNPSRLSIPLDCTYLDPVHNFLRCHCIEVFVASNADMRAPGKGARPSKIGQVGLRCFFCKDVPKNKLTKQAVCFPSKRETIFESVRNYQRTHMTACPCFPEQMKAKYERLTQQVGLQRMSQKYTKAYYAEAASELGIVETPNGLVIGAPSNESGFPSNNLQALIQAAENPATSSAFWKAYSSSKDKAAGMRKFEHVASDGTRRVIINARKESSPFVYPEDFPTVSDFEFILFHQVSPYIPLNHADQHDKLFGFCCKHCARARKGWNHNNGMYFSVDLNTLADTSFLQKMLNHFMACPHVPREVKNAFDELKRLASEHGTTAKRGSRKRFIEKIWERMKKYYGSKLDLGHEGK